MKEASRAKKPREREPPRAARTGDPRRIYILRTVLLLPSEVKIYKEAEMLRKQNNGVYRCETLLY